MARWFRGVWGKVSGMKAPPATTSSHDPPAAPKPAIPIEELKIRLKEASASIPLAARTAAEMDRAGDEAGPPGEFDQRTMARTCPGSHENLRQLKPA